MPVMTPEGIRTKRIEIEQEIERLSREVSQKKGELKELQKNCPHPNLRRTATLIRGTEYCPDCGHYESFKD